MMLFYAEHTNQFGFNRCSYQYGALIGRTAGLTAPKRIRCCVQRQSAPSAS